MFVLTRNPVELQQQVIVQKCVIQKCSVCAQHLPSNKTKTMHWCNSSATCTILRCSINSTTKQQLHKNGSAPNVSTSWKCSKKHFTEPPATNWAFPDLHSVRMPDFLMLSTQESTQYYSNMRPHHEMIREIEISVKILDRIMHVAISY